MVKKATIHTIEAFLAFILTFVFIAIVSSTFYPSDVEVKKTTILNQLEQDQYFRNCALNYDNLCLNTSLVTFDENFQKRYDFIITTNATTALPQKHIFVDSILIAANLSIYNPTTIRLYYWTK